MKAIQVSKLFVLALVLTAAAIGCKKTPVRVTDINGQNRPPGYGSEGSITTPGPSEPINTGPGTGSKPGEGIPQGPEGQWDKYIAHPEILKDDSIYFDYDSSVIKAGEKQKLSAVADYQKAHPEYGIRVEGNCDERGTVEYNLALGDRRAAAARDYLVGLGVPVARLSTTSYGKEKPVCTEHEEPCWFKNRRAHFSLK